MKQNELIQKSILEIDLNNLEEEWMLQAKRVFRYAEKVSQTKRDIAYLHSQLEVLEAEIDLRVRRHPQKYGITKPSEAAFKNAVKINREVITLKEEIIEKEFELDTYKGAVHALEHKKKGLENEVTLFGQNYFAVPYAKGVGKEVADDLQKNSARRKKHS